MKSILHFGLIFAILASSVVQCDGGNIRLKVTEKRNFKRSAREVINAANSFRRKPTLVINGEERIVIETDVNEIVHESFSERKEVYNAYLEHALPERCFLYTIYKGEFGRANDPFPSPTFPSLDLDFRQLLAMDEAERREANELQLPQDQTSFPADGFACFFRPVPGQVLVYVEYDGRTSMTYRGFVRDQIRLHNDRYDTRPGWRTSLRKAWYQFSQPGAADSFAGVSRVAVITPPTITDATCYFLDEFRRKISRSFSWETPLRMPVRAPYTVFCMPRELESAE